MSCEIRNGFRFKEKRFSLKKCLLPSSLPPLSHPFSLTLSILKRKGRKAFGLKLFLDKMRPPFATFSSLLLFYLSVFISSNIKSINPSASHSIQLRVINIKLKPRIPIEVPRSFHRKLVCTLTFEKFNPSKLYLRFLYGLDVDKKITFDGRKVPSHYEESGLIIGKFYYLLKIFSIRIFPLFFNMRTQIITNHFFKNESKIEFLMINRIYRIYPNIIN